MSERVIKPDLSFVNSVIAAGGESLKKCYQCATCTVVCNVTPEENPFPRKEMVQAQWGLKEDLFRNPDIWLCHQCSDCTAYCPRGAKPGEVLGAIRKMSLVHYSPLKPLARAVGSPKALLLLVLIPVVIFLGITAIHGSLGHVDRGEGGAIVFANFIPIPFIDTVFILAALFALFGFVIGIKRYWSDMSRGGLGKWQKVYGGGYSGAIVNTVTEILSHRKFRQCDVAGGRATSHLLVLYSFIGLAVTTTIAIVYLYGFGWESPYNFSSARDLFIKIIGNVSAAALLLGITLVITNRLKNADRAGVGGYYDWLFIGIVATIVVTGTLAELTRLANLSVAYPIYFVHLVAVFTLFAYAPFSKMAHMVYRATAMVYSRFTGRK
jgi:quinone-modifying oxidoreductase subunit QmoC